MSRKVYNITDKMVDEKPVIRWGDKEYEVNDTFVNMMRFDELDISTKEGIEEALNYTLGEGHGIDITLLRGPQIKVLLVSIIAALRGEEYEVIESRFRLE